MFTHLPHPFTPPTGQPATDDPFDDFFGDDPGSEPTDHHHSRCRAAGENYHQTLVDVAVLWITECASTGWTPADLRHEFSAQVDPLLFHSLSSITRNIPDELLEHWFADTRPGRVSAISVTSLENIVNRLPRLSPLEDWRMLSDEHLRDREAEILTSLSPEQRKAHDRIQALLRKAESTSFEKEAEALMEKAESLRQQYRVENLLATSYSDQADCETIVSTRVRLRSPWIKYQMRLLATVALANSCKALLLTESGIATVFGTADDVAHVVDLFSSLNRQREHFMQTSAGARAAQERRETSSYRRSFMVAYAQRIGALLKRAAEDVLNNLGEAAPLAPDAVLPVLKERSMRAEQALTVLFPHTRSMSVSANHQLGYLDGYDAAGRSHFGGDSSGLSLQRSLPGADNGRKFHT